jgi:benzoylformate decarboxylase
MTDMHGKDLFLEYLVSRGVPFIAGNPGSTESPLIDRLQDYPQIEYILTLHESVAIGIAEAYALAGGQIGVVNLHVAPGVGNAMGMVYNAFIGHSPLLVTAGQQDTRMRLRRPLLYHDLVEMAASVTKWSVQAETADELPLLLHQAFQIALTPPAGPVFLALPINVLEQVTDQKIIKPGTHTIRTKPDPVGIELAAQMLIEAKHPVIVFGDEIHRTGAQSELQSFAELLGTPVWGTLLSPGVGFPMTHPQYQGELPDNHKSIRECLEKADLIFLVGGDFFREVFYSPSSPWSHEVQLIQLENTPAQLTRNFHVDVGITADLKHGLNSLIEVITTLSTDAHRMACKARRLSLNEVHAGEVKKREQFIEGVRNRQPMHPACFVAALRDALPQDTVVVSEALTAELEVMGLLDLKDPGDFYGSRGGGIGQGLPGGIGVKLAHPDRPVVVLSGDGSSLFTLQTLWTAAHHNIPVIFIILNNRSYRILKINLDRYRSFFNVSGTSRYPFMDLTEPEINFVSLAAGFGVEGVCIESPEQVAPAVGEALARERPYLIDVLLEG